VKTEARLNRAHEKLREFHERWDRISLADTGHWTNQSLSYARAVGDMIKLAEVIVAGGLQRRESRGSHYRSDYPDRNDGDFLRTTVARFNAETGRPVLALEPVPAGLVRPRARTYGKVEA